MTAATGKHWVDEAVLRKLRQEREKFVAALAYANDDTRHDAEQRIVKIDCWIEAVETLDG